MGAAVAGLYAITAVGGGGQGGSGRYVYGVGEPGPGGVAPLFELASTGGTTFDLASLRGKEQVLLYFQEGLMCQPCWDQIVAIEQEMAKFKAEEGRSLVAGSAALFPPVLVLDGRPLFHGRLSERRLRKALSA